MVCLLGSQGGVVLVLFQVWGGGVKYCWNMYSSNFEANS